MKKYQVPLFIAFLFIISHVAACKKDSTSKNTSVTVNCDTVALPDNSVNGCYIELRTPKKCDEVDVSNGKLYEFAWSTNGTTCETPWSLTIAGNPPTANNQKTFTLSTNGGTITQKGGIINANSATFDGLTSYNGVYHWVISSYYGSYPASVAFKLKK